MLSKVFKGMQSEQEIYSPEKCRYVIYARKSTDESDNQARFITGPNFRMYGVMQTHTT